MQLIHVATGHPFWLTTASGWNWTPLIGVVLVLVAGRWMAGIRLGYWWIAVAAAGGQLFSFVVDRWGVVPATSLFVLPAAVAGLASRLRA